MRLKTALKSLLFSTVLLTSIGASADSYFHLPPEMERTEENVALEKEINSDSPAAVVMQCTVMAIASSPANLWNNTENCADNLKKLCEWKPKKGIMKATGGASVGQCMVFLPFLK